MLSTLIDESIVKRCSRLRLFSQKVYMAPYESYFPYLGVPSNDTPLDSSALEVGRKSNYVGWNILGDASILEFGFWKSSVLTLIGGKNPWQVILKFRGHCDYWCWFDEELGNLMTLEIFELSSSTYGVTSMLEYGATNKSLKMYMDAWPTSSISVAHDVVILFVMFPCWFKSNTFGKVLHHPLEGIFKQWSLSNLWSMICHLHSKVKFQSFQFYSWYIGLCKED